MWALPTNAGTNSGWERHFPLWDISLKLLSTIWQLQPWTPAPPLIENPFLIRDVRAFSKEVTQTFKWAHHGSLQLELTDLQADVALEEHFETTDSATFWLQIVPETSFPGLTKVALHTFTMFGSTYSCETAFSTMNIIKTMYRSRLANEHLHMSMRMALTPFKPRFKLLAGQLHAHFSYWERKLEREDGEEERREEKGSCSKLCTFLLFSKFCPVLFYLNCRHQGSCVIWFEM